ncbi:MAG: hypothetical protein LBP40_01715 [Campylobacteraceae bacterium]|jgi:aerobic-type carbon monoxide dehydrogenase small subunit (CoxS/CutS family)|nr:hypothetical protein [Campylobacteraceae bacterium]
MRAFFLFVLSLTVALSVPNTDTFQEKMDLQNAKSMFERAFGLYCSGETQDMIGAYHELIDKFEHSTNSEIRLITSQAMSNLALAYAEVNDTKAELNAHERIISKFINSNDDGIELITSKSLLRKGYIAFAANDTKGEIETAEKFIARFADTDNENIKIALAGVMTTLGRHYTLLDEYRKAIDISSKFMDKFGNYQDEYMQNQILGNLMMLSTNYIKLGEFKSGFASYQKIIDIFKNSTNPDIIRIVGGAVTNKIEIEICNNIKPSFSDENSKIAAKSEYSAFMYEFLQIIYKAQNANQSAALKSLKKKYADFNFRRLNVNFDFSDLDNWQKKLKSPEKNWIKECIDFLKEFYYK